MSDVREREYGVAATIPFALYEVDGVDLRTDWTPAAADCEISKNEGDYVACTNTATVEDGTYAILLTATEMQAARIMLKVVDAVTKVFLDRVIAIDTVGHLSANDKRHKRTIALPGQEAPPLTPNEDEVLGYLHKMLRNKTTQSSTQFNLFDDAGTTVDQKASVSQAAGVATVEEMVSGP